MFTIDITVRHTFDEKYLQEHFLDGQGFDSKEEWEKEFNTPFPKTIEDWKRLLMEEWDQNEWFFLEESNETISCE